MISLVAALPSLTQGAAQPQASPSPGFPPVFLGDLAVFQEGSALLIDDPDHSEVLQVIDLAAPLPANVVTSSRGDIYSLATDGILSKMDGKGAQVWTRRVGTGSKVTGLVVGKGGLIYSVDGSGRDFGLRFLGAGFTGNRRPGWPRGDLMIDRCTGHAYAVASPDLPVAMVLDSPGVDASPGSWPMAGHDVFQSLPILQGYRRRRLRHPPLRGSGAHNRRMTGSTSGLFSERSLRDPSENPHDGFLDRRKVELEGVRHGVELFGQLPQGRGVEGVQVGDGRSACRSRSRCLAPGPRWHGRAGQSR